MTETPENPRAELARVRFAAALTEGGTASPIAKILAASATVTTAGTGALIEIGSLRAIDTQEGLTELVARMTRGTVLAADAPVDDSAGNEAARAAGAAIGRAQKAALEASGVAFT